ncbi:MAG: Gfo/Idh/MocA family protein [Planctomycetota bacterium]|jgi:predicted dehydrogenase
MKLRLGLVGLGNYWEKRYRPALRALADRFEVRAVCEPIGRRAELAASEFGAAVVDGYQTLVGREDVDAILILSAAWYGPLPTLAACDSGKAIYFGAGLDLDPADMGRIRERVDEAGVAFLAELPRRRAPATVRLKELIATALGPPELVFCHQRLAAPSDASRSRVYSPERSMDHELVELVDWCRYVVGKEPKWVTGVARHRSAEGCQEDYHMLSLDFSQRGEPGSGPVAQISCGRYIPSQWHEAITYRPLAAMQISCQQGVAFVDLPSTLIWFDEAGRHQESLESERPVGEQMLTQFYRAVTSLVRKTCDLEDACRALAILEQAERSHREGRRIEL